ncbi:hypothetical protein RB195_015673 [Necator americanus]
MYMRNGEKDKLVRLLPAVVFNNKTKQIKLAFSAIGGGPQHSLSLPRTISMLWMYRKGMNISETVGHPLAFPGNAEGDIVFKDRVPYLEWLHRNYNVSEAAPGLPDEIVAIQLQNETTGEMDALHVNHFDEFSYMPMGL